MTRYRKIKKIGNSYFIPISKSDMRDLDLKEGSEIDLDILNVNCDHDKD